MSSLPLNVAVFFGKVDKRIRSLARKGAPTTLHNGHGRRVHADGRIRARGHRTDVPRSLQETVRLLCALTVIDFIKIDVEGAELACLQGARKLLVSHRILFIYSEFVTLLIPYYGIHDVLGAQHLFLNERGYRLIDFELRHPTYRRGPRDLPETADRRMIFAGDALFILDPDRVALDAVTKHRLAAILFVFGFSSCALSLLDESGLASKSDIERIEDGVRGTMTTRRLKLIWQELPAKLMNAFS